MAAASGVPSDTKFRACRLQQSVHERHVGINAVPRWSHQPAAWVPARESALVGLQAECDRVERIRRIDWRIVSSQDVLKRKVE